MFHRFFIRSQIAPGLEPVFRVASNYAWSFEPELQQFCTELRSKVSELGRNAAASEPPASWLHRLTFTDQQKLAQDKALIDRAKVLEQRFLSDAGRENLFWSRYSSEQKIQNQPLIAYFSAEFGIHETLPIYAGGLGILAGDHLKSASALGLPLVGVGLWYHNGYHEQRINADGAPTEFYQRVNAAMLGAKLCSLQDGSRLTVHVQMGGRVVHLQVWELNVGRVKLLLLDSDVAENTAADRAITANLYGGNVNVRIEQELALGVGGAFALEALGLKPTVYHLNEGHAAFLSLARLHSVRRDQRVELEEAAEIVSASNVFTTHTPIAAGNDVFSHSSLLPYLAPLAANLQLPIDWLLALGRETPSASEGAEGRFSMTAFALNLSNQRNGVSKEHGIVSRRLWTKLFPGLTEHEIPIGAIVNGVHMPSWSAPTLQKFYQGSADSIDAKAMWTEKRKLRRTLIDMVNVQGRQRSQLDPDICTLGFARRFAEYKRALLLFTDPERLRRLVFDPARPVQLVFAGKAHPNNEREKANIKKLNDLVREHGLQSRIAFCENYNIQVARALVQGVDMWLNTPRPPLEASGTSGMKIVQNAGMNVSVPDGWWREAYEPGLGWAIGDLYEHDSQLDENQAVSDTVRDGKDAVSLYQLLENEAVPLFYDRDNEGIPRKWLTTCATSGRKLAPQFSSDRMVEQYVRDFYMPAHSSGVTMLNDNAAEAKRAARDRAKLLEGFKHISVQLLNEVPPNLALGERVTVQARVSAPGIDVANLRVEAVVGGYPAPRIEGSALPPQTPFDFVEPVVAPMTLQASDRPDEWIARGEVDCRHPGQAVLSVRVLPKLNSRRALPLVTLG